MKKLIALLLAAMMVLSLVACGAKSEEPAEETTEETVEETAEEVTEEAVEEETEETAEETEEAEESVEEEAEASAEEAMKIAFVTGAVGADDGSFNHYTLEGIVNFCEANGLEYAVYSAEEDTDPARAAAIELAINDGFGTVVMAGATFGSTVSAVSVEYPETLFLALDITNADLSIEECPANVALICYQEEQAGYLAGYAVVKEGYKSLGVLGGKSVPAVVRYSYGFIQGAEAAAAELELTDVTINHWYAEEWSANDTITAKMDEWYKAGTEVIFSCGGSIYESCLSAAEANDGKMIGVDVDQSTISDRFITSAIKSLATSVELALTNAYTNDWAWPADYAGACQYLGASNNCIGLPMITSQFANFTATDYDSIYGSMSNGGIIVDNASDPAVHPETVNVTVNWQ